MSSPETVSLKLSSNYLQEKGKFLVSDRISDDERCNLNPKKEKLISNDRLQAILFLGYEAIIGAMDAYHERLAAANPNAKDPVKSPWVNAIRFCEYGQELRVLQTVSPRRPHAIPATEHGHIEDLRLEFQSYWSAAVEAGFGVRVKSHMKGWDRIHDGTWHQVHRDPDYPALSGTRF